MLRSRTFWKIYLSFFLFMVLNSIVVGVYLVYQLEQDELNQTQKKLTSYASLFLNEQAELLSDSPNVLRERVRNLHEKLGTRLTMVRSDGQVVADSDEDPQVMDNHGSRPEIIDAKKNGIGRSTRFSNTVKKNMMYVAVPIMDNGVVVGYSRAALPKHCCIS